MVCGNLIADGSNGTSTVRAEKSAEHTGPLAFRLLRSLNGTDTDRSDTYDFPLVIYSKFRGLSLVRFRDKGRF